MHLVVYLCVACAAIGHTTVRCVHWCVCLQTQEKAVAIVKLAAAAVVHIILTWWVQFEPQVASDTMPAKQCTRAQLGLHSRARISGLPCALQAFTLQ